MTDQLDAVTPLLVPPYVSPGATVATTWGNQVVDELTRLGQVVRQFPDVATMKLWAAPAGSVASTAGRLFIRIGSTWQTTGMTNVVRATSSEYMNLTAADFGLTTINYLIPMAARDGTGTMFLGSPLVAAGGATASVRFYYVDASLTIKLVGNGSSLTVTFVYAGVA